MIILSNGHSLEYVASSGALGFDGRGWFHERLLGLIKPKDGLPLFDPAFFQVILKTVTLTPRPGHPFAVRFIKDGALNAIGLRNRGFKWFLEKVAPKIDPRKIFAIASIAGGIGELETMARELNGFNFMALQINTSCSKYNIPSATEVIKMCEVVKKNSRYPLSVKISVVHGVETIVKEVQGIIEFFDINSVPYEIVFPDRRSPFAGIGGGAVSGKVIQRFTWPLVRKLADLSPIPTMGPSVWNFEDMAKVRECGAKAIAFGSIFLRYPWRPTSFVLKERQAMFSW